MLNSIHPIGSFGKLENLFLLFAMARREYIYYSWKTDQQLNPYRALVGGVDASGKSIFAGRNATGFSNVEEIAVDMVKVCDL